MKKVIVTILIVLFLIAIGTAYYLKGKEFTLRFTEDQIREKLESELPITKTYLILFMVTLDKPRIKLINGNDRVQAGLDVIFEIRTNNETKPLGGSIDASGGVKYLAEKGEFYLTDPVVENVAVQGIPEKYTEKAILALTKALAEYYSEHPIYSLQPTNLKHLSARLVLKDVYVINSELVVKIGI